MTIALLAPAVPAGAAVVTPGDPVDGGIGYAFSVTLGGTDNAALSSHVSAWSWEDESMFDSSAGEPPVGWTHTSNWIALTLEADALLTISLVRDPAVPYAGNGNLNGFAPVDQLYPSLTLWRGQDHDGSDFHVYNNRGNVDWAEDLSYIGHIDNSTEASVQATWALSAGTYTLAIGSNTPSDTSPPRQGYRAEFTTVVPEPGTAALAGLAAVAFASRRRVRNHQPEELSQ